jgi:hypothetical protein
MDFLIAAANSGGVRDLIDWLYNDPVVEAFALRVHGEFITLCRSDVSPDISTETRLLSGPAPQGWRSICQAAGFTADLSPIYVVIYISDPDIDSFRKRVGLSNFAAPNYAVFVEFSRRFSGTAFRKRQRPIFGGISASSHKVPEFSGTLGGLLRIESGDTYLLSCEHVLLDIDDDIIQQSPGDGGKISDKVAETKCIVPLKTPPVVFNYSSCYNRVDAALGVVDSTLTKTSSGIRQLGAVGGHLLVANIALGDDLAFVGKESDRRDAFIRSYIARVKVNLGGTTYNFGDVFEIRPRVELLLSNLSAPGDSGALVVKDTGGPPYDLSGLFFADNGNSSGLCCFIEYVFADLSVTAHGGFTIL